MKRLLATAGTVGLLATGAAAQDATVTLTAVVGEYMAVTQANDSSLTVTDPFGGSATPGNNNRNLAFGDKSNFLVSANVDFEIELAWATWQVAGASYNQAAYQGDDCKIGGTISFDTNPASNSVNTATPPSGVSPWTVNDSSAFPTSAFTAGQGKEFAIGIESSPEVNDCAGGVVPPDDYTLDVDITLSAQS